MSSACPRSLTIIKRLLDVPDVEVNCKSRDGLFALKYAASSDDEELLELLLSHPGVDVNNTDNYQNTALMMACYKRNFRIIKRLLVVPDINVNCQNARGLSAFNMEVLRINEEICINCYCTQRSGRISKPRNLRVRFNYKTAGTTGLQKIFIRNLILMAHYGVLKPLQLLHKLKVTHQHFHQ